VAREEGASLLDFEVELSAASASSVIGGAWIIDHLHPNTDGYFLLAKAVARAMREGELGFGAADWRAAPALDDGECKRLSGVSDFDRAYGNLVIADVLGDWPFAERNLLRSPRPPVDDPQAEAAARLCRSRGAGWVDCRLQLAGRYANAGRLEPAERELRSVVHVAPDFLLARVDLGVILMYESRYDEAVRQLAAVRRRWPDFAPALAAQGLLAYRRDDPAEAVRLLEQALTADAAQRTLAPPLRAEATAALVSARARLRP